MYVGLYGQRGPTPLVSLPINGMACSSTLHYSTSNTANLEDKQLFMPSSPSSLR